jgi:hypothetical protein
MEKQMGTRFIFIEYGNKDIYFKELKYSLMTLKSLHDLTADDVYVYTERVDRYKNLPITPVSIKDDVASYSLGGSYHFRIKPMVIRRALQELPVSNNLFFVDTDTYIKSSLSQRISEIKPDVVLMNEFEKTNPYAGSVLNNLLLPSGLMYSYSPNLSHMFNSGVLGVSGVHEPIFADAVAIVDGMLDAGFKAHTIEQCAVSEAFRIHGVRIHEVKKEVMHYWRGTDKKYMHNQLDRHFSARSSDRALPFFKISHNWFLARWHKLLS